VFSGEWDSSWASFLVLFDQPTLTWFSSSSATRLPHQAAAQDHHPVAALLLDPGEVHQLGQVLAAGHDGHLVLGQELVHFRRE
jgi:hypothetical protein